MKKEDIESSFTWNGFFYGTKKYRGKTKFYKSKNVRFDDTCGGTEECTSGEYFECAEKYSKVIYGR